MEDTPKTLCPAPAPADLAALLALCGAGYLAIQLFEQVVEVGGRGFPLHV